MFSDRVDPTNVGALFARCVAIRQRTMYDEIGIAANRTREMRVVVLRQSVVTERLRRITRALQTLEQPDLQRLLFRFAAK
jgi:hypothetical protein